MSWLLLALAAATLPADTIMPAPARVSRTMRLVANIPAGTLDVYSAGERTHRFRISPGKPPYQTPRGRYYIREVTWNPTWAPPPGATWATDTTRQAPGPSNPMGRAKLRFAQYLLVHGTPSANDTLLGRPASHGCLRVRNADALLLARLVTTGGGAGRDPAWLAAVEADDRRTELVSLPEAVPLDIEYTRLELEADTVRLHPDVYALGAEDPTSALVAAVRARHPWLRLRHGRIRLLLDESARRSTGAHLDALVEPQVRRRVPRLVSDRPLRLATSGRPDRRSMVRAAGPSHDPAMRWVLASRS